MNEKSTSEVQLFADDMTPHELGVSISLLLSSQLSL